jgi:prepilin-type N-terminal cleavage/methylation domain-containing protein
MEHPMAARIATAGRPASRRGFTIIEMLIAVMMLAMMMAALGIVSLTGRNAYEQAAVVSELESLGSRALARAVEELTTISGTQMNPVPNGNAGSEVLDFVQAVGFAAGNPIWGPNQRLGLEYETGEVDDGVDNDQDGLVDEGQLVLTRDVAGNPMRVVLVRGISEWGDGEVANNNVDDNANGVTDERGFNLQLIGDVISLRLWLQAVDAGNQVVTREFTSSVRLRNVGI